MSGRLDKNRMARLSRALDEQSDPFIKEDRCVHKQQLSSGAWIEMFWVPTRSGPRYCVTENIVRRRKQELDGGYPYGTYEEAAALFSRLVIEDGEEAEDTD